MTRLRWASVGGGVAVAFALGHAALGADDHESAAALLLQIEQDAVHRPTTADAAAHGREALERAGRLRGAGDEAHAKAADGLALEWAETARDLVRAADLETAGMNLRRKAVDAQARLERTRTLVEEGIARVGRLGAELDEASRSSSNGRRDGGARGSDSPAASAATKAGPAGHHPGVGASGVVTP